MTSRKYILPIFLTALVIALAPALASAQNGCTDSPENPTAILALVGAAGAVVPRLRSYLRARR
jgi:XrtJ-associated TM-motif-TM protein